ncbi:carbon-nitrogen hydrolase family protein [Gemmatimonas sp.]|uniref:carbon-nitrogen hydrolase family protein n=1 Tax=Gemmatimonas sp. TaxID=1962908 RepID=UPI003562C6C1
MTPDSIRIAGAQIAPVWLDRTATLAKVVATVHRAADGGAQLVAFGEALVPGYPFWIELTDGARFDAPVQKQLHAHYLDQAVQIEAGHLQSVCDAARDRAICVILGIIERPSARGGHSIYASLVYIDALGIVQSVHRKLMPTYEERLSWAPGDGHGLRTHALGAFTVGALNCWENWMPLARASLYAQGEDLHVAIWPGSVRNTEHITRFIARESRSYVMSVSGVLRRADIPESVPHAQLIIEHAPEILGEGGSCIANPDGSWLVEPLAHEEQIIFADCAHQRVREERQNFDVMGHYARPDVLQLNVNRTRQQSVHFTE